MSLKETALVYKYAQSFVDQIADKDTIWSIYDEVSLLIQAMKESRLNRLLNDATVSYQHKEDFVRTMRQSSYRVINDTIETVLQDGHADLILSVLEESLRQISSSQNEYDAVLASVYPLSDQQKERLKGLVETRFDVKVRQIIEEIDKDLLGGFTVTVNHRVLDASVRSQLKELRIKL